jgi:DNA-binding CsgD family transcriptional regulator
MQIATALGLDGVVGYGRSALGLLELASGNPGEAFGHLHRADRNAREAGVIEQGCLLLTADSAEAAVRARQTADAERAIEQLEADLVIVDRVVTRFALARARGGLAGDDDFDRHFEEALAHHDRLPMRFERGRTLLLYGERLRRARRRAEARLRLEEALHELEAVGARPWAARARHELEAVRAPARRRSEQTRAALDQLTAQERRIAELVRTGATNREIAEQLFLSPRTVEFHLRGAFRKLGVRTRTELVAALPEAAG